TLGRVAVDLDRLLHLPLLVAEADEDEMIPVQPDAEQAVERLAELRAHVVEAFLDLLGDLAAARRVSFWADARARTGRVLILDNHPVIDRINAPARDGELVLAFQLDARLALNEGKLPLRLDANLFFLVRHR